MRAALIYCLLTLSVALLWLGHGDAHSAERKQQPFVWPLPKSMVLEEDKAPLVVDARHFKCSFNGSSAVLAAACHRYARMMFQHVPSGEKRAGPGTVEGLAVEVGDYGEEGLAYGMDESYALAVGAHSGATLRAATVWGALRGLETFAQMVVYNFTSRQYQTAAARVADAPRFSHRGLLVDTSRHFLPLTTLCRLLDSMAYAKLNVLHWHVVDHQSFPLEVEAFPRLWDGAYSPFERYSVDDVRQVVRYAKSRGIRVVPEFDMPGHASSWCKGYPEICPSPECPSPLNPASGQTWEVVRGLLRQAAELWPDGFVHLGADEVNTTCWSATPSVQQWMRERGITAADALRQFNEEAIAAAVKLDRTVIGWDELFDVAPDLDPAHTVIEVWRSWHRGTLGQVVAAGFRAIWAPVDPWYLDQRHITWQSRYLADPFDLLPPSPEARARILGGEACMWGEQIDSSDIMPTIWPHAAAIAERLWSDISVKDVALATPRYEYFRCLLEERGIGASPARALNSDKYKNLPSSPGSCYLQ